MAQIIRFCGCGQVASASAPSLRRHSKQSSFQLCVPIFSQLVGKNCESRKPLTTLCATHSSRKERSIYYSVCGLSISKCARAWTFGSKFGCHSHSRLMQVQRHFSLKHSLLKAQKIDGKLIAQEIKDEVKAEVDALREAGKRPPHLAVILVGNDPASVVYVRNKAKAAEYTGLSCDILRLPETATEKDVLKEIDFLNNLSEVDGILVQLPVPSHINERTVCDAVVPDKDVDGFSVMNVGRFCVDQKAFIPATPSGVLEIIRRLKIKTAGKNAVVCGRSKNVGLPIALHLNSDSQGEVHEGYPYTGDATTTICHRYTSPEQLRFFTQAADIIITATGVPRLITADMVKEGVVVIDIGITRVVDERGKAKLVGDVDYNGVSEKASLITPVPGGVGPVTVAMVIKNTLSAYKREIDFGSIPTLHKDGS